MGNKYTEGINYISGNQNTQSYTKSSDLQESTNKYTAGLQYINPNYGQQKQAVSKDVYSPQTQTPDVQTWGSEPWKTVETPSMFSGTTQLTVTPAPTENEKRIKELQAQLEQIKQNAAYDLTSEHDWATDRKNVEDELRSLGDTSVDRGKNILGGWLERTGGSYLNAGATLLNQNMENDPRYQAMKNSDTLNERGQKLLAQVDEKIEKHEGWNDKATGLVNSGNEKIELGKQGLNGVGRLGVDLALGALDLGADAVANKIVPGSGLANMGVRVFGQEAANAKNRGLSHEQQVLAGIKGALIEIGTEKLAGPYDKIYGEGAFDAAIEKGIQKAAQSEAVRSALRLGWDFASEGAEEVISGIANTIADRALKLDPEAKIDVSELMYEGLVGGILGFAGGAVNPQTWNSMTPAQKAQVVQQAADTAIEQSGVIQKSYSAQANEILRDPAKKAEFVAKHGELPGSNTEQAKAIAQILYNEATRPAQNAAGAQAQQGDITTAPTQQNASTDATVELNSQSTQNGQQAGEIATDESGFTGKVVDTQNAYADANGMESGTHVQHSDAEVNSRADAMLSEKGADGVMAELANRKDGSTYAWSDVDVTAAQKAMSQMEEAAKNETDSAKRAELYRKLAEANAIYEKAGSDTGRSLRQRGVFDNSKEGIIASAAETLFSEEQGKKTRKTLTEDGKADLMTEIDGYATSLEKAESADDIIQLIHSLGIKRNTKGKFWTSADSGAIGSALTKVSQMEGGMDFLRNLCAVQIKSLATDMVKPKPIEGLKTIRYLNMLSNPATSSRNVTANTTLGALIDPVSNNGAALTDMILSIFTGKREVSFDAGYFSPEAVRGLSDAAIKSYLEVVLDADATQSQSKYSEISGRTFKMSGNWFEQYLSTIEMIQGLAMTTTDQAAKGATTAETKRGLEKLSAKSKTGDLDIEETAQLEAKKRTLQEKNGMTDFLNNTRRSLDEWIGIGNDRTGRYGLGSDLVPFAQVGANAVKTTLEMNPVTGSLNAFKQLVTLGIDSMNGTVKPGQQRAAAMATGKALNGIALVKIAAAMAAKGLIELHDDEDDSKNALEKALGRSGMQVNISALGRWVKGEDTTPRPDDRRMGIGFIPQLNSLFTIGAAMEQAYEDDGTLSAEDIFNSSLDGMFAAVGDFPAVSSITDLVNAWKYADIDEGSQLGEKAQRLIAAAGDKVGNTVTSFLVPNAVRAVAAGTDDTERNLYSDNSVIGGAWDYIKGGIPGLRETLPAQYDNWGNEITNGGGWNQFANKVLRPSTVTQGKLDPTSEAILGLAEASGDNSIIPDKKPPKSVTYDGEKHQMSLEEQTAYQKIYGDKYRSIIEDVLGIRSYKGYDAATQAAVMKEAESLAKDTAKGDYLVDSGTAKADDVSTKVDGMKKAEAARYVVAKAGYDSAKRSGNYDLIDEIISGQFSGLSKKTVDALGDNGEEMAKINKAMDNGLSTSENYFIAQDAMRGNDSDKAVDEIKAMSMILPDGDVDAMAPQKLSEAQLSYYKVLRSADYSPADFSTIYGASLNGSGNITQAALRQALESADKLSYDQKQKIWSIYAESKNWKTKKY